MANSLVKKSDIIYFKSKFFIFRLFTYFSFLLFPIWIQKTVELPLYLQSLLMVTYCLFMMGQLFMIGKEIDYRFKIYYKLNSSLDRVVYRLALGMSAFIIYSNILVYTLPSKWVYNFFWLTWFLAGMFYSWPTRGKIIRENVTTNFSEFRYLDSFEKTLIYLSCLFLVITFPKFPSPGESLVYYFDPSHQIATPFWNYLTVLFFPFKKYQDMFAIGWSIYFYFVGVGFFLLSSYALFRYFLSRRLSILAVFSIISSWTITKVLVATPGVSITSTFILLWIWSVLWTIRSSSYRTGLFSGLVLAYATIMSRTSIFLIPATLFILYKALEHRTWWFKRRLLRYMSFGMVLSVAAFFIYSTPISIHAPSLDGLIAEITSLISRKSFYILWYGGAFFIILKLFTPEHRIFDDYRVHSHRMLNLFTLLLFLVTITAIVTPQLFTGFGLMGIIALLSVLTLEVIFQSMSKLRSNRNMILLGYIIICLLDSHFEGRVKIFARLFLF